MYALSKEHKGASKLFAKTRRGIPQKLENLENQRDASSRKDSPLSSVSEISQTPSPKPVFHMNGKRAFHHKNQQEVISVQHEEMIKYIHDRWRSVKRELDAGTKFSGEPKACKFVTYYKVDKNSCPQLSNFEPFDVESFWGQRLYQNITQST